MELHQENDFKSKAYRNAAFTIGRLDFQVCEYSRESLEGIKGIGKSLAAKIQEICGTGFLTDNTDLISKTPPGILDVLKVKGLGPKKVSALWKGLGIESIGELLYACNENRLVTLKGFGAKSQSEIKANLEFIISQQGWFHYFKAEEFSKDFEKQMRQSGFYGLLIPTGEFRRCCELIQKIEFITSCENHELEPVFQKMASMGFNIKRTEVDEWKFESNNQPTVIIKSKSDSFYWNLMETTGPDEFVDRFKEKSICSISDFASCDSEESIFQKASVNYIPPEMRDLTNSFQLCQDPQLISQLISENQLKGCIHNHSTYSDGASTLEEMALECKRLGLEYFAICDHSRSAFYAGGLSVEDIHKQHLEIDELNSKLSPFKIFKGIESDILSDGSLDYPDEVLSSFDLIVASIHSGLSMSEDRATERLLKAIENPYTTILGHPTGRLLLSRRGYPINHEKVIDACANNGVAIELNAHPYRLDLDWRWIGYAAEKGVLISINPDAHHTSGISMMRYGVLVARKAGLVFDKVLNSKSLSDFESWLMSRK